MNILILNASPRKNGLVSQMLGTMADEANKCGAQAEVVDVCKLVIRPCIGCMSCRSRGKCILPNDDAQDVLEKIRRADALIIGSPCYWGNMNGQLKILFDRIVYGMMGESEKAMPVPMHKGKNAAIVATCSTPWPFNIWFNQSRGTVRSIKEVLKWSGFSIKGVIQKGATKQHHSLTQKELGKCRKVINRLII